MLLIAIGMAGQGVTSREQATDRAKTQRAEPKLPTQAEVDEALRRTLGFDVSQTWKVLYIKRSEVPGIADALIKFKEDDYEHFYILPSGQRAIKGEMVPFGPNPFAEARLKLKAADGPSRGPQTPIISMVEFSDLECPYCKAAQPLVEKLSADFPQVRYVFQHYPLPEKQHPWAKKAAKYADCAGRTSPAAFWKYIDSIYENQGSIALAIADDKLQELATAAGLDPQKLAACASSPETEVRINKSVELGNSVGIMGTPTIFINGRKVEDTTSYDQLKALMQFEIDHAEK